MTERRKKPMHPLTAALIELLKVRTIMTLALIGGGIWGFVVGLIKPEIFMPLVTAVVTFYFTKRKED